MLQRLLIAICTFVPAGILRADDSGALVIVLDSSRHMAKALGGATAQNEPSLTRLAAARDAVSSTLRSLSASEQQSVTLVLFGHRAQTAAEGSQASGEPDYYGSGNGTIANVEVIGQTETLTRDDAAALESTLETLKPTGSAPLLAAIDQALQLSSGSGSQVVVLTSGHSEADSQSSANKESVIEVIRTQQTSVSIIQVGVAEQDSALTDLRDIAHAGGGTLYTPQTASQVTEALRLASRPRQEPGRIETALRLQAEEGTAAAEESDVPAYDVMFDVTYYGAPVKDAEVIIRGPNFDLIYNRQLEYDDTSLKGNRLGGRYIFKKVPVDAAGYTLEINAVVKNRTIKVSRGFSVDDDNKVKGRSFKIQLEKANDPPPMGE